jgi:uncharacterized protein
VAKEDRGFASMDRAKQREIASKGGKAAHQKGTAHEWTSEEAREAGRKGGMASHRRRKEMMDPGTADTPGTNPTDSGERMGSDDQGEPIPKSPVIRTRDKGGSEPTRLASQDARAGTRAEPLAMYGCLVAE